MSRNNDANIDPVPDEPPPPYEPPGAADGETNTSTNHAASTPAPSTTATANNTAASTTNASTSTSTNANSNASHNPFLAPGEQSTATVASPNPGSNTNPFLSAVTPQQTGASTTSTVTSTAPAPTSNSQAPSLPPRNYAAPQSPAPSQQEPSRPSLDSRHSRTSSILSPTSSSPASSSVYAPPAGPPPPPSSSSPSSSSANRPDHRRTDSYRPTTVPTPGQPLLHKGKLLVYPRDWRGCIKCNDTGYKHGDPNNPHKSCWDKYGKTYTSAMSYSVGLNGATSNFQKPLPFVSGPPMGAVPPVRPSHGYMPGGYSGAGVGGYNASSPAPVQQGYAGYAPPIHAPPPHAPPPSSTYRPPSTPTTPNVDAETEGARMSDVPPNYQDASNVDSHERLPSQYVPPPVPPPGHGPPHNHHNHRITLHTHHNHPTASSVASDPTPAAPIRMLQFNRSTSRGTARPPPPNALVVMPGDPRIGGRLCFEVRWQRYHRKLLVGR